MIKQVLIPLCVALIVVAGFHFGRVAHIARITPASQGCVANLMCLEGAKNSWALERSKTTNETPTWTDIKPYFKGVLKCPKGGAYTLGRIGTAPQCSLGGPQHALLQ